MYRAHFAIFLLVSFLISVSLAQSFKTMDEFAKKWSPPLTEKELGLFARAPKKTSTEEAFVEVELVRDGTFRGLFCTKGVRIAVGEDPGTYLVRMATVEGLPESSYCKIKDINFYGSGEFSQKDSSPLRIDFATRFLKPSLSPILYEVNGARFANGYVSFIGIDHAQRRLKRMGYKGRFVLLDALSGDQETPFNIIFGDPFKVAGIDILPGTHAFIISFGEGDKDRIMSLDIPEGVVYKANGVSCMRHLDFHSRTFALAKCMIAKKYPLLDGWIPEKTEVFFARTNNLKAQAVPALIQNLSGPMKIQGREYKKGDDLQIVGAKVTTEFNKSAFSEHNPID